MEKKPPVKWYYKPVPITIAILCVGPFALPLLWFSPAFNKISKVIISIVVIAATIWLLKATADLYRILLDELKEIQKILANG